MLTELAPEFVGASIYFGSEQPGSLGLLFAVLGLRISLSLSSRLNSAFEFVSRLYRLWNLLLWRLYLFNLVCLAGFSFGGSTGGHRLLLLFQSSLFVSAKQLIRHFRVMRGPTITLLMRLLLSIS